MYVLHIMKLKRLRTPREESCRCCHRLLSARNAVTPKGRRLPVT
jgi:hypothetical protein